MKQLLIILVAVVGIAAHADYLYWMVSDWPQEGTTITGGSASFEWTTAQLYADGVQVSGAALTKSAWDEYQDLGGYAYANIGDNYASKSFTIELFNDDQWLARSTAANGSAPGQFITSGMSMNPAAGGWTPTSYAVPEPTRGLLFLIGGMLLGLKRRRQQV